MAGGSGDAMAEPSAAAYFAYKRAVLLGGSEWLSAPERHRRGLLRSRLCCLGQKGQETTTVTNQQSLKRSQTPLPAEGPAGLPWFLLELQETPGWLAGKRLRGRERFPA
ncbi:hypothetical protein NXF25_007612 [Crotalus adamanteus]|uniref:Uncharacterized protein n=1 Tax=Crotalus adamanteus TaxID=8729 RepID=A0AAW1BKW4_CROAD